MSNKRIYLGIDTSNYTTSVAACNEQGEVIANIKKMLDVKAGERGLRQSDAVFSHIKNFSDIASWVREEIGDNDIVAVGVSAVPRDAVGSYMPCFLSGKAVAEMLAAVNNVPITCFSHQAGHIMAALYSSGATDLLINKPFIAFHVSGGTTEALYVQSNGHSFDVNIVADTADISAGQAIDRVGVMMGLKFPCGKELEALASEYEGRLPKQRICVNDGKCNLSGLENIAQKLYKETNDKAYVSAYVLNFVAETLIALTKQIREKYPDISIVYAGGVMSNKLLKSKLSHFENTYFAEPQFSADNAAGIALLTQRKYK
ncbi:MAG: peptidase M22 [Clostridia bacterium]|nr:peptidase M22 [Clostridia bacterium]